VGLVRGELHVLRGRAVRLARQWPRDATETGTAEIFNTLKLLTVILWFGYPIFWALGAEGIGVLGVAVTSWAYSALGGGCEVRVRVPAALVRRRRAGVGHRAHEYRRGETPADD